MDEDKWPWTTSDCKPCGWRNTWNDSGDRGHAKWSHDFRFHNDEPVDNDEKKD